MRSAYLYIESIKSSCPFQGYPCELEQIENKIAPEACNDCGAEGKKIFVLEFEPLLE